LMRTKQTNHESDRDKSEMQTKSKKTRNLQEIFEYH